MLFISSLSFAQIIKELPQDEEGKFNINKVVEVKDVSKDQLFLRSKTFFVNTFKSANEVIQLEDKEEGIIIGKGTSKLMISGGLGVYIGIWMSYSIKVQSKEGRYKFEIYDVSYQGDYGKTYPEDWFSESKYYKKNGKPRGINEQYKEKTIAVFNSIENSIITTMEASKVSDTKKNEW